VYAPAITAEEVCVAEPRELFPVVFMNRENKLPDPLLEELPEPDPEELAVIEAEVVKAKVMGTPAKS
jgi:hypothetical protein